MGRALTAVAASFRQSAPRHPIHALHQHCKRCLAGLCSRRTRACSIGCTRSKVYPANHLRPSPVNFKVYMYELPSQVAFEKARQPGGGTYDPHYLAYSQVGAPGHTDTKAHAP